MSREVLLKWRSWPFVERPRTSIALVLFLLVLAAILWHVTVTTWKAPLFYYIGMILVLTNLLPWFIPTEYELDHSEVRVRYLIITIKRNYSDFGCFYQDKRGIMLSTFKMPRRLDPFRGQSLRFSGSRAEVEALNAILLDKIGKKY